MITIRIVPAALVVILGWAPILSGVRGQTASSGERKRPAGEPQLFLELLERHARLHVEKKPKAKEKVAELFARFDWSAVPVPTLTLQFATRHQRDPLKRSDFEVDCLPRTVASLATSRQWAAFAHEQMDALLVARGKVASKKIPLNRRPLQARHKARAFVFVLDRVVDEVASREMPRGGRALSSLRDTMRRGYAGFRLRTSRKTAAFAFLPPGPFLRLGAKLGDERAWEVARAFVLGARERGRAKEPNLEDAVVALLDLDARLLTVGERRERVQILRSLDREHPALSKGTRERLATWR